MAEANNWSEGLPKKQVATYAWNSGHAVQTHEGFTLQSGEEAPARPWVWVTADQYEFEERFLEFISDSNNKELGEAIKEAFSELATEFGSAMQQSIQDPIWDWPRVTQRQNGEVVSSPRNIVDTGELLNSYSLTIK